MRSPKWALLLYVRALISTVEILPSIVHQWFEELQVESLRLSVLLGGQPATKTVSKRQVALRVVLRGVVATTW